jgi:hypothetical protein
MEIDGTDHMNHGNETTTYHNRWSQVGPEQLLSLVYGMQ